MTEIGKVSVRVYPDTRGFATKAKRDLKKLNDLSFKVNVELNEYHFAARVKRLIAKTNADLLEPSNRIKFRASLEMTERQLSSEVRDIRDRLQDAAKEEKIEFEAEVSKGTRRKLGDGGLLDIDARKVIRDLSRELGRNSFPVTVDTNAKRAARDLSRSIKSEKYSIDVDMSVDRKQALSELDSFREVVEHTVGLARRMRSMKFAVDVDRASVDRWKQELEQLDSMMRVNSRSLEDQQKAYKRLGQEISDYNSKISAAQKDQELSAKREQVALEREEALTRDLAALRKEMSRSAEVRNEDIRREARLVEQIANMRRTAFERTAERAEAEARATREIAEARKQIAMLDRMRRRYQGANLEIESDIDFQEDLRRDLQEKLDRAQERLRVDSIELDVALDQTSVEAVSARLMQLSRDRLVTIFTRIQRNNLDRFTRQLGLAERHSRDLGNNIVKWIGQLAGVRVLWRTFRDMVDWLPRLDMMVPQIAQNLALITVAASGAIGALGTVFTLLSDIGEVGKLALALPAIGLGAVGSGLIIGRAIYDFKEVFPEIVSYWERLGKIVSSNVWKQAAPAVRKLHESLAPILSAQVPVWATTWGDSMKTFTNALGSEKSLAFLEQFLDNSIKGTKQAEAGWGSLGRAIMRLAGVGSEVFPDLGRWFSDTMLEFDNWTVRNEDNIERWIREGGTAIRELGSIAVSTVKIIAGVADAFEAAGWPGLTELEAGMRSLSETALGLKDSDGFMYTLIQVQEFFSGLDALGPSATRALQNVWTMIGRTVDVLTRPITSAIWEILEGFNSPKFQEGFRTFVDGVGSFIMDISPGLGAMTAEIGSLLGVVGTAAESWGPAFNEMLLLFASAGDNLHPGLTDFVENLGPELLDLVEEITPHVEDFSTALGDLLGDENFQDLIGDLIGDLGTLGGWVLQFGTWILGLVQSFSEWYGSLSETGQAVTRWSAIIAAIGGGAVALFLGALVKVGGGLMRLASVLRFLKIDKLFSRAFGWLKNTRVGKAIASIADDIALRAMYFWDTVKGAGARIVGALRTAGGAIKNAVGAIPGALGRLGERIGTAARNLIPNIKLLRDWLGTKFTGIFSTLKNSRLGVQIGRIFGPILRTLSGIPASLGRLLGGALARGGLMKLVRPVLMRFIGVLAGPVGWALLIASLIQPLAIVDFAKWVLEALGFEDTWANRLLESLSESISGYIGDGNLIDWVLQPFKDAWGHFSEGDWIAGIVDILSLGSLDIAGMVVAAIADALGFEETAEEIRNADMSTVISDALSGLGEKIGSGLQAAWDGLVEFIKEWNPITVLFNLFTWIMEKVGGWLGLTDGGGGGGGGGAAAEMELSRSMSADLDWSIGAWEKIKPKLQEGWDKLVEFIKEWNPFSLAWKLGTWLGEKIAEWLGLDAEPLDIPSLGELVSWGAGIWNDHIKPWLQDSWDGLVDFIKEWNPISLAWKLGTWLGEKVAGWLGLDTVSSDIPSLGELASWGTDVWNDHIKPWLQDSWDGLVDFIKEWNPISLAWKLGTWLGDKIKEWLGIDEGGGLDTSGFSIDFDFSSLWNEKIKPALTKGLLALAGLILAPGLLLIAPLAIPALIIGWLLGRDEEGNWSFDELKNKITGAWESIKSAFTTAVDTIKESVGALVFSPLAIATLIVDWLLGSEWVQNAKDGITTAIDNAKPVLEEAFRTGIQAIQDGLGGGFEAGKTVGEAGAGVVARLLGVDEPGQGKLKLNFEGVEGIVSRFGLTTADIYRVMSGTTLASMGEMGRGTRGEFQSTKDGALSETSSMQTGVDARFATMSAQATAKAAAMQAQVIASMGAMQAGAAAQAIRMQAQVVQAAAQTNALSVAQARAMGSAYVAAIASMVANAIRIASQLRGTLPRILAISLTGAGRTTGNSYVAGLQSGLSRAVSVARGMVGNIRRVLSINVHSSGASVGGSFASGIRSRISSVTSAANALAAAARSRMPNSPAEEGPFAGSGWGGWGESIAEELAKGLRKSAPEVAREAERLMGGVHSALDARAGASVGIDFERTRRRHGLAADGDGGYQANGTTINVAVESRSEEPLRDGNRFGGDIAFALRGAGLA